MGEVNPIPFRETKLAYAVHRLNLVLWLSTDVDGHPNGSVKDLMDNGLNLAGFPLKQNRVKSGRVLTVFLCISPEVCFKTDPRALTLPNSQMITSENTC